MSSIDKGVTHVALPVTDLDASIAFYGKYAAMQVVHHRGNRQRSDRMGAERGVDPDEHDPGGNAVAWISDLTRPFILVLIQVETVDQRLGGVYCHVGLGVDSRDDVDRLCAQARDEGRPVFGPLDSGPPVGYWGYIVDPDGHNLELSYGQEVAFTVDRAR